MQRFELIEVTGTVLESYSGTLFLVSLPNGHQVMAHLEKSSLDKVCGGGIQCLPGAKVLLELRAFDLSSGRILSVEPVQS